MGRILAGAVVTGWLILGSSVQAEEGAAPDKTREKPFVYTNADLPSASEEASPPPPPLAPTPVPSVDSLPAIPSYEDYRDRSGHGEGWWRQRAAEFDLRVLDAMIKADQLHVDLAKGKELIDPTLPARSQEATLFLRELEAARDQVPEEMRRAGGLPGWLRRGDITLPDEPLPPPVLEAPIYTERLMLAWKPVPGAAFYIVEVQCSDCCGLIHDCEVSSLDVSRTNAQFPFTAGRSGRWRVRALHAAGYSGEWSAWAEYGSPSR